MADYPDEVPQPEVSQPGVAQPEVPQLGVAQPEVFQPEVSQPGLPQLEVPQPEVAQAEISQPEAPQLVVPGPGVPQPGVPQPEVPLPEILPPVEIPYLQLECISPALPYENIPSFWIHGYMENLDVTITNMVHLTNAIIAVIPAMEERIRVITGAVTSLFLTCQLVGDLCESWDRIHVTMAQPVPRCSTDTGELKVNIELADLELWSTEMENFSQSLQGLKMILDKAETENVNYWATLGELIANSRQEDLHPLTRASSGLAAQLLKLYVEFIHYGHPDLKSMIDNLENFLHGFQGPITERIYDLLNPGGNGSTSTRGASNDSKDGASSSTM